MPDTIIEEVQEGFARDQRGRVFAVNLPDGRLRCAGFNRLGEQCKNSAGFNTKHDGEGPCTYHDDKVEVIVASTGQAVTQVGKTRKPIYHKGLAEDPLKLYKELSGQSSIQKLDLSEELGLARATLLQLLEELKAKTYRGDSFYGDVAKLVETISKVVERAQPKSTLTMTTVQGVLMRVIEVIHQEINDPAILERIVQKLSSIQVIQK